MNAPNPLRSDRSSGASVKSRCSPMSRAAVAAARAVRLAAAFQRGAAHHAAGGRRRGPARASASTAVVHPGPQRVVVDAHHQPAARRRGAHRMTSWLRLARFVAVGCAAAAVHFGVVVLLVENRHAHAARRQRRGLAGRLRGVVRGPAPADVRRPLGADAAGGARASSPSPRRASPSTRPRTRVLLHVSAIRYDVALAIVLVAVAVMTYVLSSRWAFLRSPSRHRDPVADFPQHVAAAGGRATGAGQQRIALGEILGAPTTQLRAPGQLACCSTRRQQQRRSCRPRNFAASSSSRRQLSPRVSAGSSQLLDHRPPASAGRHRTAGRRSSRAGSDRLARMRRQRGRQAARALVRHEQGAHDDRHAQQRRHGHRAALPGAPRGPVAAPASARRSGKPAAARPAGCSPPAWTPAVRRSRRSATSQTHISRRTCARIGAAVRRARCARRGAAATRSRAGRSSASTRGEEPERLRVVEALLRVAAEVLDDEEVMQEVREALRIDDEPGRRDHAGRQQAGPPQQPQDLHRPPAQQQPDHQHQARQHDADQALGQHAERGAHSRASSACAARRSVASSRAACANARMVAVMQPATSMSRLAYCADDEDQRHRDQHAAASCAPVARRRAGAPNR